MLIIATLFNIIFLQPWTRHPSPRWTAPPPPSQRNRPSDRLDTIIIIIVIIIIIKYGDRIFTNLNYHH